MQGLPVLLRKRLAAILLMLVCLALPRAAQAQSETDRGIDDVIGELLALTDLDGLSVSPRRDAAVFQTRTADSANNTYRLNWMVLTETGVRRISDAGYVRLQVIAGGASDVGPHVDPAAFQCFSTNSRTITHWTDAGSP